MYWILALDFRNNPFHRRLWHVIHVNPGSLKTKKNPNTKSCTNHPQPTNVLDRWAPVSQSLFCFFFSNPQELSTPARWEHSYHFDYCFILLITQLRLQKASSDWHYKVLAAVLSHQLWMSAVFQGCESKNCIPLEHFSSSLSYWEVLRFWKLFQATSRVALSSISQQDHTFLSLWLLSCQQCRMQGLP